MTTKTDTIANTTRASVRALCLAGSMLALTATMTGPGNAQSRIELQRAPSGHLLLPVTLEGGDPLTFILDTGASNTAIAQPVAEAIGFVSQWESYDLVQSLNARFDAERHDIAQLGIPGAPPVGLNSVVIPVPADHPLPVAGLLGADAILSDRYEIDVDDLALILDSAAAEHPDGQVERRGLLIGEARLRRRSAPVHVIIDTGSSHTLINRQLRRHLYDPGIQFNFDIHVSGIEDAEGEEARPVMLRQLQIGGLCVERSAALQSDLDVFDALGWADEPAMVIGMDTLRHARIRIDRTTGTFEISGTTEDTQCHGRRVQTPGL
ncbi:retroviral-like aspartic protease family protein [Maricaulis maris]|uniref:Aspartyl protease n=1 Tax=Maricaulis maris TaxID=74318 RepID=A0A495DDW6_9PROT|nr:retroviral-like aspartic protease family protein [Maricaulis maris]RKR00470.1 aspartyl protease [Maricaulis maris]